VRITTQEYRLGNWVRAPGRRGQAPHSPAWDIGEKVQLWTVGDPPTHVQDFDGCEARILGPIGPARTTDPATSHAAGRTVKVNRGRAAVLAALREHGPMTDEQIWEHVKLVCSRSGARTRRSELVDAGLVRDSKTRGTTNAGRATIIWEVTP